MADVEYEERDEYREAFVALPRTWWQRLLRRPERVTKQMVLDRVVVMRRERVGDQTLHMVTAVDAFALAHGREQAMRAARGYLDVASVRAKKRMGLG